MFNFGRLDLFDMKKILILTYILFVTLVGNTQTIAIQSFEPSGGHLESRHVIYNCLHGFY